MIKNNYKACTLIECQRWNIYYNWQKENLNLKIKFLVKNIVIVVKEKQQ